MAGYQDQLIGPAPYVETIPVDAYTRVGMIKQQRYDEGVQKVQGYIDSIAGIEALMPEQKDYLNQRIGQLQSQVSQIASQDFSNQQIVNSVGHLTNKIASDPIIQNTVYASNAYRAENAKMKEAQEKGKSAPANEYVYQSSVSNWLNSHDAGKQFNATYDPYTDYSSKILKTLNESILGKGRENEWVTEMPFKRGADGKALVDANGMPQYDYNTLIEKYKGVSAEQIRNVIETTLDGNDRKQMAIDGQYNYRGLDKQGLKGITDASYSGRINQIQSTIEGLKVEQSTNQGDPTALAKIKQELEYQEKLLENGKQGYLNDLDSIDKDPEGYKGSLYSQNWLSQFSEGLSYAQHSLTYGDNPGFKNSLDEKRLALNWEEFVANKEYQYADLAIKQKELDIKLGKLGGAGGNLSTREPITNTNHVTQLDEFTQGIEDEKNQLELQDMALLARKNSNLVDRRYDDKGNPYFVWAYDTNASPEQQKIQAEQNKAAGQAALSTYRMANGTSEPDIESWKASTAAIRANVNAGMKVVSDAQANADKVPELNLDKQLAALGGVTVRDASGNQHTIAAKDVFTFTQKVKKILSNSGVNIDTSAATGMGGQTFLLDFFASKEATDALIKSNAAAQFTKPEEKALYSIMSRAGSTEFGARHGGIPLNSADRQVMNKIAAVQGVGDDIFEKRQAHIANQLKNVLPAFQPVATPLEQWKGEDKNKAAAWVQEQLVGGGGKANTGLNFDEGKVVSMLGKANIDNTKFYIIDRGNDKFSVRISNADVIGSKQMEIDLTRAGVESLMGGAMGVDMFKNMRDMQRYSSLSNGPLTTNVLRGGATTATPLNNGNIKGFKVKYDIEQGNGGGQMIKLYVYDNITKENKTVYLDPGTMLNEAQAIAALQFMTDDTIKMAIKNQPKQ